MTYSNSLRNLERLAPYLDQLVTDTVDELRFPTSSYGLAYQLRQAFAIAANIKHPIYASLRDKWKLSEHGNHVIAKPRRLATITNVTTKVFPDITDFAGVCSVVTNHNLPSLIFPAAKLSVGELTNLYYWLDSKYKLFPSNNMLALSKSGENEWVPDV